LAEVPFPGKPTDEVSQRAEAKPVAYGDAQKTQRNNLWLEQTKMGSQSGGNGGGKPAEHEIERVGRLPGVGPEQGNGAQKEKKKNKEQVRPGNGKVACPGNRGKSRVKLNVRLSRSTVTEVMEPCPDGESRRKRPSTLV